ncbi:GNAT family N-acetyltransferase [Halococcus sp. AFM35]|uniref:GNAT family N-acetyltransferase n=1 Tax=Halococcus sp. AFM35 TaxID=3421653 RepID=UPI003EBC3052
MTRNSKDTGAVCNAWDYTDCKGTEYCPPRCPRFFDTEGTALLIKPYEPDHWKVLVEMYEDIDTYSRTLGLPPSSSERIKEWLAHLTSNGWNLVAVDCDDIIGHIAAAPLDGDEPGFVVFVHQTYQNRGVGTELIKHLIAHADDRGHKALTLTVASGNRRAITVYDNIGFDVTERLPSEITMRLSIDDSIAKQAQLPPVEQNQHH